MSGRPDHVPLYATDEQIARELFGPGKSSLSDWMTLSTVLARQGMPQPDPITGRRYWPAVRAYLDRRAGLREDSPTPRVDGQENFDDRPRRPRAQAAPA